MGWMMLYSGIIKILNPAWTSAGYLKGALTFNWFYSLLANPGILQVVDLLNKWGLALIGLSLILGIFVRISSVLGAILMILYYFPVLNFPYVGTHGYIVNEHIVYAMVFILFFISDAGKFFGFDSRIRLSIKK